MKKLLLIAVTVSLLLSGCSVHKPTSTLLQKSSVADTETDVVMQRVRPLPSPAFILGRYGRPNLKWNPRAGSQQGK